MTPELTASLISVIPFCIIFILIIIWYLFSYKNIKRRKALKELWFTDEEIDKLILRKDWKEIGKIALIKAEEKLKNDKIEKDLILNKKLSILLEE